LAARYPVIRRLVGELSFRVVARRFILSHPLGLVARPFLEVEVRRLPPGGYAFLCALSEGKNVARAAEIATEVAAKFDVVQASG
jgi:hypothetical protein